MDELPIEADHIDEQALRETVLAHHPGGQGTSSGRQLEVAVALDRDQAVALHARHGLRHRRHALGEPLRDPRTQRHCAFFLEFEDRPQIHLDGVDKIMLVVHTYDCVALAACAQNSAG